MEEAESEEEEDELPMYQEHYNALFSMDFVETKYPHDDTMRLLGSLRMWSWSSRTCAWPSSSLPHGVIQGAHLLGMDHVLGKGERKVTFRQLEILWFHLWEGTHWDIKENELQRVGLQSLRRYSSSRSRAQIRSPVLRYVHKALANTFFARKALGQSMRRTTLLQDNAYSTGFKREGSLVLEGHHTNPSVQLESIWTREGLLQQDGWTLSFARPTSSLNTRSWMGGSNSSSHIHWLALPSFFCPTLSSPRCRRYNIDFSPHYTLVGHEEDLREEEPEARSS
ncbi:unnamed protein product [Microthlaspi erraticum]|uniref:Arabidopsis retrotransposon Orf1 C-terminal domain-containing protein n=1 Tax=Microthlaspi erraticum TaxID=1685480 RepID=A0A6D2JN38_9BRAS|nr:unnamed protein product [Microthlaspi erraticum]